MNGLVSDYYNLTGQKNININDITLTGKFQGSDSNYYIGIKSNIQEQINNLNSSIVIYYGISGYFQNDNASISGLLYNYNLQNNNNNFYNVSISGLLYNYNLQNNFNNNFIDITNTLSGLIYLKAARGPIGLTGNNGFNGSNGSNGNDGRDGRDGRNGKDGAGGAASGGVIGAIINGIATIGLGASVALIFTSLTAAISLIQAQITTIIAEIGFANAKIWGLQTNTISLQSQVSALIAQIAVSDALIAELQVKTALLNGNTFTGTLLIFGNIEQTSSFIPNVFISPVFMAKNLYVEGVIVGNEYGFNN